MIPALEMNFETTQSFIEKYRQEELLLPLNELLLEEDPKRTLQMIAINKIVEDLDLLDTGKPRVLPSIRILSFIEIRRKHIKMKS